MRVRGKIRYREEVFENSLVVIMKSHACRKDNVFPKYDLSRSCIEIANFGNEVLIVCMRWTGVLGSGVIEETTDIEWKAGKNLTVRQVVKKGAAGKKVIYPTHRVK